MKLFGERFWVELSRILVGATFLFSGFVKAVDPFGFAYKIEDYLIALGLESFFPLALPAAVAIVTAEFSLGAFLLAGILRRPSVRLIGLFMLFFTPFTLWIAISNPVADCGCFGDAFVISNWQTFYKNVVLLGATVLLNLKWRVIKPIFSGKYVVLGMVFILLFALTFSLRNVYRLPLLDFRPFKVGANIPGQMHVDQEKADVWETVFVYRRDGMEKEFSEDNYPWDDSTWTFVEMKSKLVKEGQKPAIEDFDLVSIVYNDTTDSWMVGENVTNRILERSSYTFLMIASSLEEMNLRQLKRFEEVHRFAAEKGYWFFLLTSSSAESIGTWEGVHHSGFSFCHADERVLKTMIRSNPGLILIKEGTVMGKWDDCTVPTTQKLQSALSSDDDDRSSSGGAIPLILTVAVFFVPLMILRWLEVHNHGQRRPGVREI